MDKRIKRLLKSMKVDVLWYFLRSRIYINKIAVPVVKDLSFQQPLYDALARAGVELVALTPRNLADNPISERALIYDDPDRLKTAREYLERGYRGVALVRGLEICGDIWYAAAENQATRKIHPDLKWLKMECGFDEVYAFDMYLRPDKRGHNLAGLLQGGALYEIWQQGFARARGYYWADNIPALWVHRTLKWQELKRVKVTRFMALHFSIN